MAGGAPRSPTAAASVPTVKLENKEGEGKGTALERDGHTAPRRTMSTQRPAVGRTGWTGEAKGTEATGRLVRNLLWYRCAEDDARRLSERVDEMLQMGASPDKEPAGTMLRSLYSRPGFAETSRECRLLGLHEMMTEIFRPPSRDETERKGEAVVVLNRGRIVSLLGLVCAYAESFPDDREAVADAVASFVDESGVQRWIDDNGCWGGAIAAEVDGQRKARSRRRRRRRNASVSEETERGKEERAKEEYEEKAITGRRRRTRGRGMARLAGIVVAAALVATAIALGHPAPWYN